MPSPMFPSPCDNAPVVAHQHPLFCTFTPPSIVRTVLKGLSSLTIIPTQATSSDLNALQANVISAIRLFSTCQSQHPLDLRCVRLSHSTVDAILLTTLCLDGADVSSTRFGPVTNVSFCHATLRHADVGAVPWRGVTGWRCHMPHAHFFRTIFEESDWTAATLSHSHWDTMSIRYSAMNWVDAHGATLDGCTILGSGFKHARLTYAKVSGGTVSDTLFCGAILNRACFQGVRFRAVDFTGSMWEGTQVRDCQFIDVTLSHDATNAPIQALFNRFSSDQQCAVIGYVTMALSTLSHLSDHYRSRFDTRSPHPYEPVVIQSLMHQMAQLAAYPHRHTPCAKVGGGLGLRSKDTLVVWGALKGVRRQALSHLWVSMTDLNGPSSTVDQPVEEGT